MEKEIMDGRLEEMLRSKDFDSLDDKEKKYALERISKREYSVIREVILNVTESKNDYTITPSKEDKDLLLDRFNSFHNSNESTLDKIARFSMPVYKVAAAMLIILSVAYFINMKFFPSSHENIVYITDTIYKEILVPENIWLADSSTRARYYANDQKNLDFEHIESINHAGHTPAIEVMNTYDMNIIARQTGMVSDRELTDFRRKQNKGKSLLEDSILRGFLISVY